MRDSRTFLLAGMAVPMLYFGTLVLGGLLVADYSHLSQYASELGMAESPAARLFNGGILATAIATVLASIGIYLVVRQESSGRVWSTLAAAPLALFGIGLVFGALFPMPDPRHGGFGLGMAIHAAPLFLALALRSVPQRRRLVRFLFLMTVLMLAFLAPMMGIGGLVTRENVGLFQRLYALMIFGWIGIASYALLETPAHES